MRPTACCKPNRTRAQHARTAASHCHFSAEVDGAHIQRIIEKDLKPSGGSYGGVQSHQRASEEWADDAAGLR